MVMKYGYVIHGKYKNKFGRIIKDTAQYVYLELCTGDTIRVHKRNVAFFNPLTWEEAKRLAEEWERKIARRVQSMPKRPKRGPRLKLATGGKVVKREKVGQEEYKFTRQGRLVYKGKYIQIHQGPDKELYISPTFAYVIKEVLSYPMATWTGEPEKTRVTRYRRKPYFEEVMIPARRLAQIWDYVEELKLPRPAKKELVEVVRSWLKGSKK